MLILDPNYEKKQRFQENLEKKKAWKEVNIYFILIFI